MPARLKINFFSPLPPLPTEIANHTATVAPEIAARADLCLWTTQESWDAARLPGITVRRYVPGTTRYRELHQADANFYNLGNNATFHQAIHDLARQVPGIVILHDTKLQHFFARYGEREGEGRVFYLQAMQRCHGAAARLAAEAFIAGECPLQDLVDRYPMTLAATEGAIGVILHNEPESRALQRETRIPVHYVPLAARFGPAPRREPRRSGALRLVMFGFIGDNRRFASVVEALSGLPAHERFVLDVYGRADEPDKMEQLVRDAGLGGQVRIHGYVSEEALDRALAESDLALNLRWPSMGEASASQLRIWQAALPSLVTRTGWYATLPPETVFFVEPQREVETIRAHLQALRRDPARFAAAGRRGRAQLEREHRPAGYAAALTEIAAAAPAQHVRRGAIDLARLGTREMLAAMPADLAERFVPLVAARIRDVLAPEAD